MCAPGPRGAEAGSWGRRRGPGRPAGLGSPLRGGGQRSGAGAAAGLGSPLSGWGLPLEPWGSVGLACMGPSSGPEELAFLRSVLGDLGP